MPPAPVIDDASVAGDRGSPCPAHGFEQCVNKNKKFQCEVDEILRAPSYAAASGDVFFFAKIDRAGYGYGYATDALHVTSVPPGGQELLPQRVAQRA